MFGRRPDAQRVRDLPAVRRFMPFVSPRRNESLVYFAQELDVEAALRFVEGRGSTTLFHVLLRAVARALHERPRLNRFTAGGRLWQRNGVWITLSAKQRFDDDAPILTVKRRFEVGESLDEMVDAVQARLAGGRAGRKGASDREMEWLLRLPPPLIRAVLAGVRGLDALGLLPRALIEADPLYTSVFLANLGSVGLEAGYHHLWEWGTCPLFGVIGRLHPGSDGRRRVVVKWSFDERVEDGLYCARSLGLLHDGLAHPEKL